MAYSYNRGRSWDEDDLNVGIYRENCILCVFNVDLLPFEDKSRGHTKQDELEMTLNYWSIGDEKNLDNMEICYWKF